MYTQTNVVKGAYRLASLFIGAVMFLASVMPAAAFTIIPSRPIDPGLLGFNTNVVPRITDLQVNPSSFDPSKDDVSISFTTNTQASVSVRVLDSSKSLIRQIIQGASLGSGTHMYYWGGQNTSGGHVAAGVYTVEVTASNTYGHNLETATVTVYYGQVQTKLQVVSHYANPATFDPHTATTVISYELNKEAYVTVRIMHGSTVVKYLKTNSKELKGSATWDGKNSSGTIQPESTYTYEVYARINSEEATGAGNIIVQYAAQSTDLQITSHYASPSVCKPNNTDAGIYYSLNKPAYTTITIKYNGTLVRTLQSNYYGQSHTAVWDCKNDSGVFNSEGVYTYEIYATIGGKYATASGSISLQSSTNPPVTNLQITQHYADPKTFNPYDENTTVYYTLNQDAYVTIKIKNNGSTIRTIQTSTSGTNGGASWDGRKSNGDMVSEGTYQYEITASGDNNSMVTATGYVVVDYDYDNNGNGNYCYYQNGYYYCEDNNNYPYINVNSVKPDPFNPYMETMELDYTLSGGSADLTIEVYDREHYDTDRHIVTLLDKVHTNTGSRYVKWNGKDYAGSVVSEGIYTFKMVATNSHGADTEYVDVEVSYDAVCEDNNYCPSYKTKPYIFNDYASPNPFKVGGNNETKIYFSLSTSAKATVTIAKDGTGIRTLQTEGFAAGGKNYVKWNGKDYNGNYISVGTYTYKIYAENSYGSDIKTDYLYVTSTVGETVPCGGYSDIDVSSAYCKAIIEMQKLGIFEGYADGTFGAYNPINRAETVKVILRALNRPIKLADGNDAGFIDVNTSAWYMNYIYTARMMGVINGYPDSTFKPGKTVGKAELLKIFLKATGTALPTCTYAPYKDTPIDYKTKWYMPYACYAKQYTLVDANNGYLNPSEPMKRGDVAQLFYRYQMQNLFNKVTNPQYTNY